MTSFQIIMLLNLLLRFPVAVKNKEYLSTHLVILDRRNQEKMIDHIPKGINRNMSYILVDVRNYFQSVSVLRHLQDEPDVVLIVSSLCDTSIHAFIADRWKYAVLLCTGEFNNRPGDGRITSSKIRCYTRIIPQLRANVHGISAPSIRIPIGKILSQILYRSKRSSAIVFHDTRPESEAIVHELTVSCSLHSRLAVSAILSTTRESVRQMLMNANSTETMEMKTFLLICNESAMINILSEASNLDDRTTGITTMSSWIVLLPQSRRYILEELSPRLDNVAVISYPEITDPLSWEKLTSIPNSSPVSSTVNRTLVTSTTDMQWFGNIHTLLYKKEGRVLSSVAYFDIHGQLNLKCDVFPNTKTGFNGRLLISSMKEYSPYVYIKRNASSVTFTGLCVDLLSNLADALNFTFQITQPPDDKWGTFTNGTWDGLIRQLQFNEVDVVVAPLTVREDRESVMDFTYPYFYDAAGAIFKRPGSKRWSTLLRPFKWNVLLCLGVIIICSTLFLFTMEKGRRLYYEEIKQTIPHGYSFEDAFWYIWGTFLKHGSQYQPQSISGNILVIFVSLFCIIISAAYSGNLIAFLTITREYVPFRTSTELADQEQYKWGTINGSLWQLQIATSNHSDFQRLWHGMSRFSQSDPDVLASSSKVHKKKVEEGNYVFFFDRSVMEIWVQANCHLTLLDETFRQITFGVGLPNHSPYLRMFSKVLMKFEKAGLLSLLKRKWWPDNGICKEDKIQVKTRRIEVEDLQSAFYLLLIGISLAVVILMMEHFKNSWRVGHKLSLRKTSISDTKNKIS